MSKQQKLRWGLIGASDIAETRMIPAINAQPDSGVHSVVSGNADHAKSYAKKNSISQAHESLETFLAEPGIVGEREAKIAGADDGDAQLAVESQDLS